MTTGEEMINDLKEYEYNYFDSETGLEWLVVKDEDTFWYEAEGLVKRLGDNWRMPIMSELKGLYKKGLGTRNMPPELKNTGWYVWSCQVGATDGYEQDLAWGVCFGSGGGTPSRCSSSGGRRAFAVRYRK